MKGNISVTGNIGRDPEIRFGQKSAVTSISIAVTPRFKVGNEWKDAEAIWFKAAFFGAKAEEIVDTYKKGQRVQITGSLTIGQPWTDAGGRHHEGGYEISSATVELSPWDSTDRQSSPTQAPLTQVPEGNLVDNSKAPF